MNEIYQSLLQRNAHETTPFLSIHQSNATLLNQVDSLQAKYQLAERQISQLQEELATAAAVATSTTGASTNGSSASTSSTAAAAAALKSEKRLREKLERLQEQLNNKLQLESDKNAAALQSAKELSRLKDLKAEQDQTIENLRQEQLRTERAIEHLTNELKNAKADTKLAEQQYEGLKTTIRTLQEENDDLKKENRELESRLVTDKAKLVEEMNKLTDMVDGLKKEANMLRSLKEQDDKRNKGSSLISWWNKSDKSGTIKTQEGVDDDDDDDARKFGSLDVVVPSAPKHTIAAHTSEGMCLRYDSAGADLVATASGDGIVKVWDTSTGIARATLRGTPGHAMMSCDLYDNLAVGAGTDKTCRVWNVRTERMLHHLVGHQNKVTCVRFVGDRGVVTGSTDRSLKLWDISRQTYRQNITMRHSSPSACIDTATESSTAVSAHLDGGLRFWDLRNGDRTADLKELHEGSITSVQFNPSNHLQVLTNGTDSCLKLIDIRTGKPIHVLRQPGDFSTAQSWSQSTLSPDGKYAAAGSANGAIFVWNMTTGKLQAKLQSHATGVCGMGWSRGGTSGQQVASLDRKGILILWA